MINEFTVVFEQDEVDGGYIAYCLEVPGANSQGETKAEARENVAKAIVLMLEDRRDDGRRGLPPEAEQEVIVVADPKECGRLCLSRELTQEAIVVECA